MVQRKKISRKFYTRDVLVVAPELIGKIMVVRFGEEIFRRFRVTETEAYRGIEDKACHASKGRTPRTEIMFHEGGHLYIYLIYGMYWMLNVVTGREGNPQAVLIRGVENYDGPGKLTRAIGIDKSYYGEDLVFSDRLWFEDDGLIPVIETGPRIGVDYSGDYWSSIQWRYFSKY